MRAAAAIAALLSCLVLTGACPGGVREESRRIGGCATDTIPLDMTIVPSCDDAASPVRISILSVERERYGIYVETSVGLVSLLDSLDVVICNVPRLVVIREGPCWPRCRIDIRLERGSEKRLPEIRAALAEGTLAGLRPSGKRPDGYGLFFVQAGVGSTDRWTLWYDRPRH